MKKRPITKLTPLFKNKLAKAKQLKDQIKHKAQEFSAKAQLENGALSKEALLSGLGCENFSADCDFNSGLNST